MTDFSALYKKYAPDVFGFALYLSGERGEAEDITSETFVRVWTSPEPLEMATVRGYLFTIARNLFLQGLRKKSRNVELDQRFPDSLPGPYAQAEQKDEVRNVLAGLQKLPEVESFAKLAPSAPPPDLELRSLRRTHHLLALQKWLFAIGIGLFATSFSFRFSSVGGHIQGPHFLLLDDPLAFVGCVAPGLACWIAYFILRRRLRATAP
jgi:hypothetical protein